MQQKYPILSRDPGRLLVFLMAVSLAFVLAAIARG